MTKEQQVAQIASAALRKTPLVLLLIVFALVVAGALALAFRHAQEAKGVGAVDPPSSGVAYGDETQAQEVFAASAFSTTLTYTSLDAPDDGEVSSQVTWDDAWFAADETAYNHELARTAAVLSALAYSESGYYQANSSQPAYMEDALAQLGFSEVSTASYRYRSEVVDEVLDLVTSDSDSVAYTIARKHLSCGDGVKRDLILVSARGSYGSEWLSNLDLSSTESSDHRGYLRASQEICAEVGTWAVQSRADGAEVEVLLVGHSRGGAVVNLAAAALDDARTDESAQAESGAQVGDVNRVYAYTFASPATTQSAEAGASQYGNIFNIVNPSDIMPYLPLSAWGYKRYGVSLYLPGMGDAGFDAQHVKMQEAYEKTVGVECAYDPADKETVDAVLADVSSSVSSVDELLTPHGAMAVFLAVTAHVNPFRILYSHYPSTYIAWLSVIDADELARE